MNGGRGDRVDIELSPSNGMGRIAHGRPNRRRSALLPTAGSALLLAGLLTFGVTGWEHLFHTAHLGLAGSAGDHLAHALRDGSLAFPMGLVAVVVTRLLARTLRLAVGRGGGDLLVRAALLSLVFGALLIPSVGLHSVADSFFDPDGGAHAHSLGHDSLDTDASLAGMALHGIRDALLGQLAAFPLALAGLKLGELAQARPWRRLSASPRGAATVTWSAPTSDGASPISAYVVMMWTNKSLTPVKRVTFPATATGGTVTGLTAGTTYTFTIAAVNGVGPGPAWPVTNAVTAS